MGKCPLQTKHGDTICIGGQLWELTYSEMGPPDSRQSAGECPHCLRERRKWDAIAAKIDAVDDPR